MLTPAKTKTPKLLGKARSGVRDPHDSCVLAILSLSILILVNYKVPHP